MVARKLWACLSQYHTDEFTVFPPSPPMVSHLYTGKSTQTILSCHESTHTPQRFTQSACKFNDYKGLLAGGWCGKNRAGLASHGPMVGWPNSKTSPDVGPIKRSARKSHLHIPLPLLVGILRRKGIWYFRGRMETTAAERTTTADLPSILLGDP